METIPASCETRSRRRHLVAVALLLPLLLDLCSLRVQGQMTWFYDSVLSPPPEVPYITFGSATAISPDGNLLVVGASSEDQINDKYGAGSLTVFRRGPGGWIKDVVLTAETPEANASLGSAVAVTNDRVIGGAPSADSGAGRLTPFTFSGSAWTRQTELEGSAGSRLGFSLATDGTFLVAGGPEYLNSQGIVIVFTIDGTGKWASLISLLGATADSARMGSCIAFGPGLIAAGAYTESDNSGAVYVWAMSGGTVDSTATRISTSTPLAALSQFGKSVAVISSTNIAVGYSDPGSVVLFFTLSSGTWSQSSTLVAPPAVTYFGQMLSYSQGNLLVSSSGRAHVYSVSGNSISASYTELAPTGVTVLDSYGTTSISVSGTYALITEGNMYASPPVQRAYLFQGLGIKSVVLSSKSKSENMGYKVALWNDNAIISVPFCFDTSKSCDGGYILLYQWNSVSSKWDYNTRVRNPFRNRDNKFGYNIYVRGEYLFVSVRNSEYVDKNVGIIVVYKWNSAKKTYEKNAIIRYRKTDKVYALGHAISSFGAITAIGMPEYDESATLTSSGAVHAYKKLDSGKWGKRKLITAPTPSADEFFGQSVSLQSETRIAISNNPTDTSLQAVHIFESSEDGWEWAQTLAETAKAGFGWSVKFFDDLLYVSAASEAGSITVYEADAQGKYSFLYTFQPATPVDDERFGFSFATDGTRFVVGTQPCVDGAACNIKGSAYIFTKNSSDQWTEQQHHALGVDDGSDGFGFDVAVSGGTVLISAPFDTSPTRSGAVYFVTK